MYIVLTIIYTPMQPLPYKGWNHHSNLKHTHIHTHPLNLSECIAFLRWGSYAFRQFLQAEQNVHLIKHAWEAWSLVINFTEVQRHEWFNITVDAWLFEQDCCWLASTQKHVYCNESGPDGLLFRREGLLLFGWLA